MKASIFKMKAFIYMIALSFLTACGYNDFDPARPEVVEGPGADNITIAGLKSHFSGLPVTVAANVRLSGYVTTSDEAGNFYRSFFIDDGTAGMEIMAGLYELHSIYRPGQKITVDAGGLTLGMRDGVIQLGLASGAGSTQAGYMEHRVILGRHLFRREIFEAVKPLKRTVGEMNESIVGRLVRIEGLYPDGEYPAGTAWSGKLKFRSSPQDSVYVNTSSYAVFAHKEVPQGRITVTGILLKGKNENYYQLKIRDLNDVISE